MQLLPRSKYSEQPSIVSGDPTSSHLPRPPSVCTPRGGSTWNTGEENRQQVCESLPSWSLGVDVPLSTVGVLSMSWLLFMKMFKVREQLKRTRLAQLESHRQRAKVYSA